MNHQGLALVRTVGLASALAFALAGPAVAQFPDPPGQSTSQSAQSPWPSQPSQSQPSQSPWPDSTPSSAPAQSAPSPWPDSSGRSSAPRNASPFPAPGASGPSGGDSCNEFVSLRQRAEDGAKAIKNASSRKASREEVCPLFRRFASAEATMVKFLEQNQKRCGVPAEAVKEARSQHAETIKIRNQVCAAPPKPAGPSLSDAFGGSAVPAPAEQQRGYGIFDTLTGNALDR